MFKWGGGGGKEKEPRYISSNYDVLNRNQTSTIYRNIPVFFSAGLIKRSISFKNFVSRKFRFFPIPPPAIFYNYNYWSHGPIVMKFDMLIN